MNAKREPSDLPELALDHEVRRLMELHRGQWTAIEPIAGVSLSWMTKFMCGKIKNPGYATLKKLHVLLNDRPVSPPPLRLQEFADAMAKTPAVRRRRRRVPTIGADQS